MTADGVLAIFRELSKTIAELHARGIVVGDLNDGNVALTREPAGRLEPWLIDADSMQLPGFACSVAHERFLDPRLYGVDLAKAVALSKESDWYALAVMLFGALVFVHPFGGTHPSHPTLLRRAEARHSVLRGDVKLPRSALRPDVLADDALAFFSDVFERDRRAPLPPACLDARFSRCACGVEHARAACPACTARVHVRPVVRAAGRLRATTVFRARRGRIVAAASPGGRLEHAHVDRGALLREDGEPVLPAEIDLGSVLSVRVSGRSTWVEVPGRMLRLSGGRIVESVAVASTHGERAADAGPAGLVCVSGASLLRSADGTRIGQVLEGQTRMRVGARLGFAFYRAGAVTVSFVFDVRRGPLRQVGLPAIAGRLVDWSASFDDDHVLVGLTTEQGGAASHVAHLVDARGALVATHRGAPLGPACVSAGAVIAAIPGEGLVLHRVDRATRTLVPVRRYVEAKDLVCPEDALLVGPGGSLYVVSHDEIVHLAFIET